jgi:hypothetical protein
MKGALLVLRVVADVNFLNETWTIESLYITIS